MKTHVCPVPFIIWRYTLTAMIVDSRKSYNNTYSEAYLGGRFHPDS